ncbi:phage tail protein [Limnobacter sp.]|uniref:phage tail protein n=1 Tax=Limnobacter sp. TaxID=2003368 RepID=UPI0025BE8F1E|nr:phage tail protein [Limnobacter sp.]
MAQADQQIQNDNGSNVRADLNNNFDALFSNNSGSSEPSVTTAFMWFADTTNDALKIRNAADSAFITVGTLSETNLGLAVKASPAFTGNVTIPAGTVSSLPLSFTGDTDTGFFKNADNEFTIVTGGTRRAHFDTNGITIRDRKALRFRDTSNSNFVAIRAPDNAAADITLTLPSSDGNANDVLQSDGSGNLSFAALPQAVPTGSVHLMAGNNVPSGYLKCNGQAVSQTTYAALYQVIGATYGQTATTFNLPDLRGEFVRGWDDSRGVDSGRDFGSAQGHEFFSHNHVITDPGHSHSINDPGHFHNVAYTNSDNGDGVIEESGTGFNGFEPTENATTNISINLNHTGISIQNQGSEARPRNIAMMYVIKT